MFRRHLLKKLKHFCPAFMKTFCISHNFFLNFELPIKTPIYMKHHIRLWLDKSWSGKAGKQVMIAVLIFAIALVSAYAITLLFSLNSSPNPKPASVAVTSSQEVSERHNAETESADMPSDKTVSSPAAAASANQVSEAPSPEQVFVDMVSPVTLRTKAYDSEEKMPQSFLGLTLLYLLGSIFFSGVLIATITNIIRTRADKFRNGLVSYPFSNHVVVLGYNEQLVGLICRISDSHHNNARIVLAVSHDVDKIYSRLRYQLPNEVLGCVLVLCADRCDKELLRRRVRIHKACEVYIIGEEEETSDTLNMNCYGIISSICNGHMPECVVNLRDQSTFALFQTYMGMKNSDEQSPDNEAFDKNLSHLHTFNYCDEWARIMLMGQAVPASNLNGSACFLDYRSEQDNLLRHPDKCVHIVIAGMTDMGEALARETAFLCHYPNFITHGIRTKVTFIDDNARCTMRDFISRYHNLFDLCRYSYRDRSTGETLQSIPSKEKDFLDIEFEFIQASMMDEPLRNEIARWALDDKQLLTLAICHQHSQRNITTGLSLPNVIYDTKTPVWIFQPAKGNIRQYLQNSKFNNVVTFGEIDHNFPSLIDTREIRMSKLLNHFYYNMNNEHIDYSNRQQIDEEWRSTQIYNRWSCLFNVSAIPVKIRSCGGIESLISDQNIRQNAIVEHNRWNVEKLLLGFRSTTDEEHRQIVALGNAEKKRLKNVFIHDDIRPYEQLSEATAATDIAFVKEIPNIEKALFQKEALQAFGSKAENRQKN